MNETKSIGRPLDGPGFGRDDKDSDGDGDSDRISDT